MTVTFVNNTQNRVSLFWIDPQGVRKFYMHIGPGRAKAQPTFVGHSWVAVDEASGADVLTVRVQAGFPTVEIGSAP